VHRNPRPRPSVHPTRDLWKAPGAFTGQVEQDDHPSAVTAVPELVPLYPRDTVLRPVHYATEHLNRRTIGRFRRRIVLVPPPTARLRKLPERKTHPGHPTDRIQQNRTVSRRHRVLVLVHNPLTIRPRDHAERHAIKAPPAADEELDYRRYWLTALLDDLADDDLADDDPVDRAAPATAVFADVADLALVSRGHWSGTGRWLTRRLREIDPALGERLVAGLQAAVHGGVSGLRSCGDAELDRIGGPLDSGYGRHA
jgi:hypothetical protein